MMTARAVRQYVRRSPAEWAGIVEEYQQSGKSRSVFSVERGISVKSLDYHLLKQRRAVRTGPRLLPVELVSSPTSDAMLRVELSNGRRIAVGPRIAAIFSVVESCRRLGLPIRNYLGDILPGLANQSIQTLAGITPTAYTARQTK
jgi:hypothetical protein